MIRATEAICGITLGAALFFSYLWALGVIQ